MRSYLKWPSQAGKWTHSSREQPEDSHACAIGDDQRQRLSGDLGSPPYRGPSDLLVGRRLKPMQMSYPFRVNATGYCDPLCRCVPEQPEQRSSVPGVPHHITVWQPASRHGSARNGFDPEGLFVGCRDLIGPNRIHDMRNTWQVYLSKRADIRRRTLELRPRGRLAVSYNRGVAGSTRGAATTTSMHHQSSLCSTWLTNTATQSALEVITHS
jgi:hypothetical protein